jgi:peptidoglycan hydrolase CwlO-like protein
MEPSQSEIDHMLELIKEFQQIVKNSLNYRNKTVAEIKAQTARVKEIGAEMKAFKEKYPKCKIH